MASKEITLGTFRDHGNTVQYFTVLEDFITLASISSFVSTNLPFDKRLALCLFQAVVLTLTHVKVNTPL